MSGTLARENATRNPKRTSATAAALMIGVALVGFITILASSVKASIGDTVDHAFTGDLVIDSGLWSGGGLSPQLAADLAALPEVDAVTGFRNVPAEVDGSSSMVVGVDPQTTDARRPGGHRRLARRPRHHRDRRPERHGRQPRLGARRHRPRAVRRDRRPAAHGGRHLRRR